MSNNEAFNIKYIDELDKRILYLPSLSDLSDHVRVKGKIIELLKETDKHIVLDMENVEFIDSSGVSIIIMIFNLLMNEDRKLYIINANEMIKETINIAKLHKYIDLI